MTVDIESISVEFESPPRWMLPASLGIIGRIDSFIQREQTCNVKEPAAYTGFLFP